VLQHKMLRFDNVGMSILMMFTNVQLYFRVMRNNPISFVPHIVKSQHFML
jgi:hypothetical protein